MEAPEQSPSDSSNGSKSSNSKSSNGNNGSKSSSSKGSNGSNGSNGNNGSKSSSSDEQGPQPPSVKIEPERVEVPAAGGISTHQLRNDSQMRLAFKIKMSNNEHYRVNHVYGFVEEGASTTIEVKRLEGPPRNDTMLIQLLEVGADDADPQAPFKEGLPPVTELRVPLIAN